MSAAPALVLPQVWATATIAIPDPVAELRDCRARKAPGRLRLVCAAAATANGAALAKARPAGAMAAPAAAANTAAEPAGLPFYRKYTEGLLRRYVTLSFSAGRVPSLLGRELFRGNVTHYQVSGFDDVVIFVQDVERCVSKLTLAQQLLLRKIAMEGHEQGEVSAMLGVPLRTVVRRYAEALDRLTRLLLEGRLLRPLDALPELKV